MALDESKDVVKAFIKNGPGLRELEFAVTDPCPNGTNRSTKFEFDEKDCQIIPVINSILDGMTRIIKEPHCSWNDFLWKITGKTKICFCSHPGINYDATFEIVNYSPLKRKGEIYFTIIKK